MGSEKSAAHDAAEKNRTEGGTLYLVATPIGNLSDITERALKTLREADFIAAEDTRNTLRLLTHFGIHKELISYHEHNKESRGAVIAERLSAGESCALVTDAGMPAISDPGEDVVRLCADAGIPVHVVPGPCAAVSALALSALSTARFAFEGFLPSASAAKKRRLNEIRGERRTIIFYEAPHRLVRTLTDLSEFFGGDRRISLCRELTKLNEETIRTTLSGALSYYSEREPRGEYVLILEGADEAGVDRETPCEYPSSEAEHVDMYIRAGMSRMDAIKRAAKDRGVSKSELYKILNSDKHAEN